MDGGDSGRKLLDIGGVTAPIMTADETNAMLVPSIVFYDNPQHTAVMRDMLKVHCSSQCTLQYPAHLVSI